MVRREEPRDLPPPPPPPLQMLLRAVADSVGWADADAHQSVRAGTPAGDVPWGQGERGSHAGQLWGKARGGIDSLARD